MLAGTAAQAWKASHREWTDKLKKVGDVFAWLLTKDDAEVIALLAHCTAHATDSTGMNGASEQTLALASACKLDMRDYWQPTAEGFLKRVPKSVVLDALREVDAGLDFGPFERAKKAELCAMAEPILVRASGFLRCCGWWTRRAVGRRGGGLVPPPLLLFGSRRLA